MDIAALSIGLSQMKVAQEASIAVMKIAMDTAKGDSSEIASLLESGNREMTTPALPHLGGNIDIVL